MTALCLVVLSKHEIRRRLESGDLKIDPTPDGSRIKQVSIDLRLGRKFTTFKGLPDYIPRIRVKSSLFSSGDLWSHTEADSFEIGPGEFVLAQTLERIELPNDLVGLVEGRSSWARVGLSVHLTAPKIDPGFNGTITLEIANMGTATVELVAEEDQPAQLMLLELSHPLGDADVYGSEDSDLFQFQSDPIPRRAE